MSLFCFLNRVDAAKRLAPRLAEYSKDPETLILGLARGGVVVAAELGRRLKLPFFPFIVRKIGHPENPEFAIGAMAEGGTTVLNKDTIAYSGLSPQAVRHVIKEETEEMARRLRIYRKEKPLPPLKNQTVLLVDDGMATGSSMAVAVQDLKKSGAKKVIVAVPVSSAEAAALLQKQADRFVCLEIPEAFYAVGQFYADFPQTTDKEVLELLKAPPSVP